MAFNIDHTESGNFTLKGNFADASGFFVFPTLPNNSEFVLITNKNSSPQSIAGLEQKLSNLLDKENVGDVLLLQTGYSSGKVPFIESDNYLNDIIFPHSILNNVFSVPVTGSLTLLSNAIKGDIANVVNPLSSYVLTGLPYSNSGNWIKLEDSENTIKSINSGVTGTLYSPSGSVKISGGQIRVSDTSSNYSGVTLDYLGQIYNTGYWDAAKAASGIYTLDDIDNLDNVYETKVGLTARLENYELTGDLSTGYAKTGDIAPELSKKLLKSLTGSVASLNSGLSAGNVVVLNQDAYIDSSLIPYISITDTFKVQSSGELTGLNNALIGDIAIDSNTSLTYILSETGGFAYQDINNWKNFVYSQGEVATINLQLPDPFNNVKLTSLNVLDLSGVSVSSSVLNTTRQINDVNLNTETTGHFCPLTGNYTKTIEFDAIASTKSDSSHSHEISKISSLQSNLNVRNNFEFLGNYSHQSVSGGNTIESGVSGALAFGTSGRSLKNHEVARAISGELGLGQISNYVFHGSSADSNWLDLAEIPACVNTFGLFNSNIIGTTTGQNRKIASFSVQRAAIRTNTDASLLLDDVVNTRVLDDPSYASRFVVKDSNFVLQVKGDAEMNWIASVDYLRVNSSVVASIQTIGYFFKSLTQDDKDWFDLSNWYPQTNPNVNGYFLPTTGSDVVMTGAVGAFINLDDPRWITPKSIDATNVSDSNGVCFYSQKYTSFTGNIIGNFSFFGKSTL